MTTTDKKLEKTRKDLEKRNAEFMGLNRKGQRLQIAKDVLSQLESRKIEADHCYFSFSDEGTDGGMGATASCLQNQTTPTNLAEVTAQTTCQVCGIGSLFLAAIERDSAYKIGGVGRNKGYIPVDRYEIIKHLSPYFTEDELNLVECYFEQDVSWHPLRPKLAKTATDWEALEGAVMNCVDWEIWKIGNDDQRLKAIMNNIVKNGGTFKPNEKKPEKA